MKAEGPEGLSRLTKATRSPVVQPWVEAGQAGVELLILHHDTQ